MDELEKLEAIVDSNGDEVQILKALQKKLAATIDATTSARELAPLSKQLREVTERLNQIGNGSGSEIDELLEQRRTRRSRLG